MSGNELIEAAMKLGRESFVYSKAKKGDVVSGYWFDRSCDPIRFAFNYLNELYFILPYRPDYVYFDHRKIIEMDYKVNLRKAIRLSRISVTTYPSIDYLFYFGGAGIQRWIDEKGWRKEEGWNGNFNEPAADEYNDWWQSTHPFYSNEDLYAFEGGWPLIWPDDDQPLLFNPDNQFVICTLKDPEPWLEVYRNENSHNAYWRNT